MMAKPVTPLEASLYGHVAAFLRQQLQLKGWGAAQLNHALGNDRGNAVVYKWLNGHGAPALAYRQKLAKVFGVKPESFVAREGGKALVPVPEVPAPTVARPQPRGADVLSFNVNLEGEARLRLDVTMPAAQAMPLLRLIMDHAEIKRLMQEAG